MTSLATAKVLLFIALNVGPHNSSTVFATSKSECYTWTTSPSHGWVVKTPSFPASDFTRDPSHEMIVGAAPTDADVPRHMRALAHHNWATGPLIFDNGDRIEKAGDHAFYIINAGGANEKVFTILFPKDDRTK